MIAIVAAPRRFATASKKRLKAMPAFIQKLSNPGAGRAARPSHVASFHAGPWLPRPSVAYAEPLAPPLPLQGYVESWEVNVREDEVAWLTGKRDASWWTGPVPLPGKCAGVLADGTITSLPLPDTRTATREELLAYFDNGWALTEVLFGALQGPEAFYRPPYHELRHPLIFYYGHPAVLYVNKLQVAGLLDGPIDPYFEGIFEVGVDEMSWDDMHKNHMVWPSVKEVNSYRRKVYAAVRSVLESHPAFASLASAPTPQRSPFWALVMGFEHERIHVETSSVLMRELPMRLLRRPEQWPAYHPYVTQKGRPLSDPKAGKDFPAMEMVGVEETEVRLGKPSDFPSFGWDNEYGHKDMRVKSFRASKHLVSNGAFYEFVCDGGYFDRANWTEQGWRWRSFRNTRHPTFWLPTGPSGLRAFRLRTVFDAVDMPWANPVDVNYHEASAYCRWLSRRHGRTGAQEYRVLTEAEHHAIRDPCEPYADPVQAKRGDQKTANTNLAYGMSTPVDAFPPSQKGFHDVFGSAWQWCEDHFNALPGFKVHPYYEDFSMPCLDGQHHIIMGGSFASTGDMASRFARFHFRPHFFQHSSFRVVEPNAKDPALVTSCMDNEGPSVVAGAFRSSANTRANKAQYEDSEWLQRYLHLHYPDLTDPDCVPSYLPPRALDFPRRCAELLSTTAKDVGAPMERALDLGCAVGGSTFALGRDYKEVHGIELSDSFVEAAKALQKDGQLAYDIRSEGEVFSSMLARAPADVDPARLVFAQGDAMALPPSLGSFDAVLFANVVCRLPDPSLCLRRLVSEDTAVVRPGGLIMLTTPFSWKPEFTPKDLWLGGRLGVDGKPLKSLDGLKAHMEGMGMELLRLQDMPLVIRYHARFYEMVVAAATVWRRK